VDETAKQQQQHNTTCQTRHMLDNNTNNIQCDEHCETTTEKQEKQQHQPNAWFKLRNSNTNPTWVRNDTNNTTKTTTQNNTTTTNAWLKLRNNKNTNTNKCLDEAAKQQQHLPNGWNNPTRQMLDNTTTQMWWTPRNNITNSETPAQASAKQEKQHEPNAWLKLRNLQQQQQQHHNSAWFKLRNNNLHQHKHQQTPTSPPITQQKQHQHQMRG
jgi:hypothetical protein